MEFNFIGKRRYLYALSAIVFTVAPASLIFKGLNLGLDFQGGSEFRYRFARDVKENEIRESFKSGDLRKIAADLIIQRVLYQGEEGDTGSEYLFRTRKDLSADEEFRSRLEASLQVMPDAQVTYLSSNIIGPVVGQNLIENTIIAILFSTVVILLYMSLRFEFRPGVTSTIALIHDTLAVLGAVSLTWYEVDITTVAAILTVLGYSLNDSIVVLDRVRENLRLKSKVPFEELVNLSINQSLARTIFTSLTTFLTLTTLFVFGPEILRNFAFTLMIGIVSGTLSTICLVTPLLVDWYYWDHPDKRPRPTPA